MGNFINVFLYAIGSQRVSRIRDRYATLEGVSVWN